MRILEDGHSTGHRLGIGEITLAPHTEGLLTHPARSQISPPTSTSSRTAALPISTCSTSGTCGT
jgi:hypothetical protein